MELNIDAIRAVLQYIKIPPIAEAYGPESNISLREKS